MIKMNKITKKIAVLFSVLIVLVSTASVFSYMGNPSIEGPHSDEQRHELMQKAFEENNYQLWLEQMTIEGKKYGVLNKVNESNFEKFAQMRKAYLSGDNEKANELRVELGLGLKNKNGSGNEMKNNGIGNGNKNGKHMNLQGKNYNGNNKKINNENCPNMQ